MTRIEIDELERVTKSLLSHIREQGIEYVDLDEDFYWNVPEADRYDSYNEPKELTLGQLSDDWNELAKIAEGDRERISYALVWLSSIYRVLGYKLVI